jgi:hypothetical protein
MRGGYFISDDFLEKEADMSSTLDEEKIRTLAKALDDAVEKHNIEELVSYFSEKCEIEFLGIKLTGHEGLKKALGWMFEYLKEIRLIPITIIIQGNIFFEEFTVRAKIRAGREIVVKQAEVLEYGNGYKVEILRLYFDRLELAPAFSANFLDRILIDRITKVSLKGL